MPMEKEHCCTAPVRQAIELKRLQVQDFDRLFSLLVQSFPVDEYRTYEEHRALLSRSDYTVYACMEKDLLRGALTVWDIGAYAFVEHFAVDPTCRNCGLGSAMLNRLKECLHRQICLEVELPETEQARRRIAFYQRNGFYLNPYPYCQPALAPGKHPVPLLLMTTGGTLDLEAFSKLRTSILTGVYGDKL